MVPFLKGEMHEAKLPDDQGSEALKRGREVTEKADSRHLEAWGGALQGPEGQTAHSSPVPIFRGGSRSQCRLLTRNSRVTVEFTSSFKTRPWDGTLRTGDLIFVSS